MRKRAPIPTKDTNKRRDETLKPRANPRTQIRKKKVVNKQTGLFTKRRIVIFILSIFALGFITYQILSHYIDNLVESRLTNNVSSRSGAVFSAPLVIKYGMKIPPEKLVEILRSRGYSEKNEPPSRQGEFWQHKIQMEIITKGYINEDGVKVPSKKFLYNTHSGMLVSNGVMHENLELEPVEISSLNSGEYKASSYYPLNEIPQSIQKAIILTEDERFYEHSGIDFIGISRAMFANIKARKIVQGGSTLTQQLAKNSFFSPKKTYGRKFMEALAARSLERFLTKDQILEKYLNEVYLGQEGAVAIHGVAEASRTFFNKNITDINPREAAMIAGIIKAPSYYSPRRHYQRALKRSNIVLEKMYQGKALSEEEYARATAFEPKINMEQKHSPLAPYFHVALLKALEEEVNLNAVVLDGMKVYTGLHTEMQKCGSKAVSDGLANIIKQYPSLNRKSSPLQCGLVAIEPHSGLIRAWVGGNDYASNQFDHVIQGKRQIGSTVKPFLYLTALDGNLNTYKIATTDSILPDEPTTFNLPNHKQWTPQNFDKKFRGSVTLRYALEKSLNVPAAYIGGKVGVKALVNTLKNFHVAETIPEVPAITLGALDSSLLDLTSAYAALANGGIYVYPRLFTNVNNEDTKIAEVDIIEENAADDAPVYVLTNILQGVIQRGTGASIKRMGFTRDAAGKTGTSDDARDAWFVGYTPNLAVGVWLGFDDNKKIGVTGGAVAAPIWGNFMKCIEPYLPDMNFVVPSDVVFVDIDIATHQKADRYTPTQRIVKEVYVKGTEPLPLDRSFSYRESSDYRRKRSSFWDFLPWN